MLFKNVFFLFFLFFWQNKKNVLFKFNVIYSTILINFDVFEKTILKIVNNLSKKILKPELFWKFDANYLLYVSWNKLKNWSIREIFQRFQGKFENSIEKFSKFDARFETFFPSNPTSKQNINNWIILLFYEKVRYSNFKNNY